MTSKNNSINVSPDVIKEFFKNSNKTLWFGALSFEARCYASVSALRNIDMHITEGIALNYKSQINPPKDGKESRDKNWKTLSGFKGNVFLKDIIQSDFISPYSFQEFQYYLERIVEKFNPEFVIFDITCFTKIHTLALAVSLSQTNLNFKWVIAYSTPENYGNLDNTFKACGWKDIIVAPLAETALLFNEAHSRGIIIPGHEADRLILALAEIEPSGGLILITDTFRRPDLRILSERKNRKIIRQLTSMRSSDWSTNIINLSDFSLLQKYIQSQIDIAKKYKAPVIFFPFGPKSVLFFTAFQLCLEYSEAAWFVYPIPAGYDIDYSEGIENTFWLSRDILNITRERQEY